MTDLMACLFRLSRLWLWCYPSLFRRSATKSSSVWPLLARLGSRWAWLRGIIMCLKKHCGFLSRLFSFSRSCASRFQLTFSSLTGKGRAAAEASGRRSLRQVTGVLPDSVLFNWLSILIPSTFFAGYPGTGESKSDSPPVSIWRTYFVANEWNKIQTIRQISPTFQIIAVLFFLEVHVTRTLSTLWIMPGVLIADTLLCRVQVLGFSNYALSEPVSTTERSLQAFTPPYNMTLRYGLASILWLCIGLLQVHRCHTGCSMNSIGVFLN